MNAFVVFTILGLLATAMPLTGAAAPSFYRLEDADRQVPTVLSVEGRTLRLHGAAVLRMGLVFKVYAAALYLPDGVSAEQVLSDIPKRLEVYYLHNTPKHRMIDTANKTLADNLTADELQRLAPLVERWHAAYRDGQKGDVAAITYVPGRGTEYALNGEPRVLIPGAAFAAAYFGVWLGDDPSSRSVKNQLLTPIGGQTATTTDNEPNAPNRIP